MTTYVAPLEVVSLARNLLTAQSNNVAILALLIWDFNLMFGDEVNYIWMRSWSLLSLLWFLLRYPVIVSHVFIVIAFSSNGWSPELCVILNRNRFAIPILTFFSCVGWMQVKIFLVCLSLISGRICWCLRTYALWNRPRWLIVLSTPLAITETTITLFAAMKIKHTPIPAGLQQICVASPEHMSWFIMSCVLSFILDTAMSSLSIVRARRVSRKFKTPLTAQLIRDGLGYYCLMTATYVIGFVIYLLDPMRLFMMAHTLVGLLALISARFLLNLRMLKWEDQEYKSRQLAANFTEPGDTMSYSVSFGMLTGVEGFVDQFELDDMRRRDTSGIRPRTARGALRTSTAPQSTG